MYRKRQTAKESADRKRQNLKGELGEKVTDGKGDFRKMTVEKYKIVMIRRGA